MLPIPGRTPLPKSGRPEAGKQADRNPLKNSHLGHLTCDGPHRLRTGNLTLDALD
jgi:hypothetical protein